MHIMINTAEPISALDLELLRVIVQRSGPTEKAENRIVGKTAPAEGWVTDPEEPGAVVEERPDTDRGGAREAEAGEPTPADPVAEEKPRRKRRTKAEMEAARAAEAAAEAEQDEQVQEAADEPEAASEAPAAADAPSPTVIEKFREEAVAKATEMVAGGQREQVVAALEAVSAKKVSQVPDDKLAEFVGLLKS